MKCCEAIRKTRFCPECGKQLYGTNILYGLLRHIEVQVTNNQKIINAWQKCQEEEDCDQARKARLDKVITSKSKILDKWQSWQESLTELLKDGNDS